MKKSNKVIIGAILMLIVLMGIGYAAMTATELTITATAAATGSQDNFKVYFTGTPSVGDANTTTAAKGAESEPVTATMTVTGLTTKNQTASAVFEISNMSPEIDAESVKVKTDGTDTANFSVETKMYKDANATQEVGASDTYEVAANGGKIYAKVVVTLLKTPVKDIAAETFTITLSATPKGLN